jgi:hypothetical protein
MMAYGKRMMTLWGYEGVWGTYEALSCPQRKVSIQTIRLALGAYNLEFDRS